MMPRRPVPSAEEPGFIGRASPDVSWLRSRQQGRNTRRRNGLEKISLETCASSAVPLVMRGVVGHCDEAHGPRLCPLPQCLGQLVAVRIAQVELYEHECWTERLSDLERTLGR